MNRFLLLTLAFSFFLGCSEEENNDDTEEQLCSVASGAWDASTITCDGTSQTIGNISMSFDQTAGTIVRRDGAADCISARTYSVVYGSLAPTLALTGAENLACTQSGVAASSCSGTTNSCDDTTSNVSLENDFDQCVLFNENSISITRTVSAQHVSDGVTACADGESEIITLGPQTSATRALLTISDGPTYDYGTVNTGSSAQYTFIITNSGSGDATSVIPAALSTPFAFFGGGYPGTGGTCTTLLSVGTSCTVVIDYSPTTAVAHTGTLELAYNDGAGAQIATRPIQGTGNSGSTAVLVISDGPTYDYGTLALGGNATKTFIVTNSGSVTATSINGSGLAAPFSFFGGSYPGTGGTCTTSVLATASCAIVVEYAPSLAGSHSNTINLDYNDGVAAQTATRDIQGIAAIPALLTISEADPYDFGSISTGNNNNHIFTVTNAGGFAAANLTETGLSTPFGFTGGAYPGIAGTCSLSLLSAASCDLDITFSPSALGAHTDSISLQYNDGASLQNTARDIQGTGI